MATAYYIDSTNSRHTLDPEVHALTMTGDDSLFLDVTGSIRAFGHRADGVRFENAPADGGLTSITVNGVIASQHASGIHTLEGGAKITIGTSGRVYGHIYGIQLSGSNVVTNHGIIISDGTGIGQALGAAGQMTLINTGTIGAVDAPYIAVGGSDSADVVINHGRIIGRVLLGSGDDVYHGQLGTVTAEINLGSGNDAAFGGAGNETFITEAASVEQDVIDGGRGTDHIVLLGIQDMIIDLRITTQQAIGNGFFQILNVENITTNNGADKITGSDVANVLKAGQGQDTLLGGRGNDTLDGGEGNDTLDGGEGIDTADFSTDWWITVDLTLSGGQNTGHGTDTLIGIENLSGSAGADRFTGSSGANRDRKSVV